MNNSCTLCKVLSMQEEMKKREIMKWNVWAPLRRNAHRLLSLLLLPCQQYSKRSTNNHVNKAHNKREKLAAYMNYLHISTFTVTNDNAHVATLGTKCRNYQYQSPRTCTLLVMIEVLRLQRTTSFRKNIQIHTGKPCRAHILPTILKTRFTRELSQE